MTDIEELNSAIDELQEAKRKLARRTKSFEMRLNNLQTFSRQMPEPWRTGVCDIIANGRLDHMIPYTRNAIQSPLSRIERRNHGQER